MPPISFSSLPKQLVWTYPTGSDIVRAGEKNLLRWQTTMDKEATLEYSINNGPWKKIQQRISLSQKTFQWMAPELTGMAKLKLTIPSLKITKVSDEFFISSATNLQVGFNCADSLLLYWNGQPNNQYQLFQLGEKYLQPISTTLDTFCILKKDLSSVYYAVAPKVNNRYGLRSALINYTLQGTACYFQSFNAWLQEGHQAYLETSLGSLHGVQQLAFQKKAGNNFSILHTITSLSATSASFLDQSLKEGINSYRTAITLQNGSVLYSPVESVYYFPADPVLLFPNPTVQNKPVRIIAKEPGIYSIAVYDGIGKLVHKETLNDLTQQVSTHQLSKGIYLVYIHSNGGKSYTKKLIVQ